MKKYTNENIEYILGQNAEENWNLLDTLKQENNNYIWFHLNSFPSPYVIMKKELLEIPEEYRQQHLLYGASLCKDNTKYRYLKDLKICYTTLKKITKGKKIGEVIIQGKRGIIKL